MADNQSRTPEIGPIGRNVIEGVEHMRALRGLSLRKLSEKLAELGRPIAPLGLSRLGQAKRRVDVDDLVALAAALGVSPGTLLFPRKAVWGEMVTVAPNAEWRAWIVWEWMSARGILPPEDPGPDAGHELTDEQIADFRKNTLPELAMYAKDPLVAAAELLLLRAKLAARNMHEGNAEWWKKHVGVQIQRTELALQDKVASPPPKPGTLNAVASFPAPRVTTGGPDEGAPGGR
jgi:hypothetical protein